jgi:hypothetical protein
VTRSVRLRHVRLPNDDPALEAARSASGPLKHDGDPARATTEALVVERFLLLEGVDANELSDLFDDAPCVSDIEAVPGFGELA